MSFLWEKLVRPVLFSMDPERAHELGMKALRSGVGRIFAGGGPVPELPVEAFGIRFSNPLGVAAGFDKNGKAVDALASLGFGSIEVGTVTFRPQPGNPKPRMFRLPEHKALVNRLGFNNEGAEPVARRLATLKRDGVLGINVGRNKDVPNEEAVENYLSALEIVHPYADYIAVNVSSPNTPDLRELQRAESLDQLLGALTKRNTELGEKPLLVKIAPDLSDGEIREIADICIDAGISGVIATNTTIGRVGLSKEEIARVGAGGMSGRPLAGLSSRVIETLYTHTQGKLPIIGVGGVFSGADAFEKIAAGASLIQAYTGFVYSGPDFARKLLDDLSKMLEDNGFSSVAEAVGCKAAGPS